MKDHIEEDGVRYVREASLPSAPNAEVAIVLGAEPSFGGGLVVRCPNCGDTTGLHINGVRVENAAGQRLIATASGEDAKSHITSSFDNDGSIEGRRHEVSITGDCEHCTGFVLTFTQHKGQTFFSRT